MHVLMRIVPCAVAGVLFASVRHHNLMTLATAILFAKSMTWHIARVIGVRMLRNEIRLCNILPMDGPDPSLLVLGYVCQTLN